MSIQAVAWAIRQKVGSPTGKVLLICLANYADDKAQCWPSQATIAQETELGERAVREWLGRLEFSGYIVRQRRHRRDGSRTSDLIRLRIDNEAERIEMALPAKTAGRAGVQPAIDAEPSGSSRQTYRRQVPPNDPAKDPSVPESSSDAEAQFQQLWQEWPNTARPENKGYARALFARLAAADRMAAVECAARYRQCQQQRRCFPALLTYLKDRQFAELAGAPEIDREGYFVITPQREEWAAWMADMDARWGQASAAHAERFGYVRTKSRWPAHDKGNSSQNSST